MIRLEDSQQRETLRSRHEIFVDFNKICVFYGKCCVHIYKYVFIVVKIKCVNSSRISDICDKINFTTNYTHFTIPDRHLSKHTQYFIKIHINITNFNTFDRQSRNWT